VLQKNKSMGTTALARVFLCKYYPAPQLWRELRIKTNNSKCMYTYYYFEAGVAHDMGFFFTQTNCTICKFMIYNKHKRLKNYIERF